MERGTLLVGALAGFALSTVTLLVFAEPPATAPDPTTHDKLNHIVELLERIECREPAPPVAAQPASERRPVLADQASDITLAQLHADVRSIRGLLDRQRQVSEVLPAMMNAGAVQAAIALGERDSRQLHSQLAMMSSREVLRRFGRPSGINTDPGYWTYLQAGGERLTIFFAGNLVSDTSTRVPDVR